MTSQVNRSIHPAYTAPAPALLRSPVQPFVVTGDTVFTAVQHGDGQCTVQVERLTGATGGSVFGQERSPCVKVRMLQDHAVASGSALLSPPPPHGNCTRPVSGPGKSADLPSQSVCHAPPACYQAGLGDTAGPPSGGRRPAPATRSFNSGTNVTLPSVVNFKAKGPDSEPEGTWVFRIDRPSPPDGRPDRINQIRLPTRTAKHRFKSFFQVSGSMPEEVLVSSAFRVQVAQIHRSRPGFVLIAQSRRSARLAPPSEALRTRAHVAPTATGSRRQHPPPTTLEARRHHGLRLSFPVAYRCSTDRPGDYFLLVPVPAR